MFRTLLTTYREWQHARAKARRERLTARAAELVDGRAYDLLFLHTRGFVRARGTGQSITQIYGEIENLIDRKVNVLIKPGTYFVARGDRQNMVTRREYAFTLYPAATQNVSIDAACINADRPIPTKDDRFEGVRRVSDDLARFLEASIGAGAMVVQAGVWALTDGYSGDDVRQHLVHVDQHGNRTQAVSERDVVEARRILAELGIRNAL